MLGQTEKETSERAVHLGIIIDITNMAASMKTGVTAAVRNLSRDSAFKSSNATSIFVSKLNPVTSKTEWVVEPENFDYHQEIAR